MNASLCYEYSGIIGLIKSGVCIVLLIREGNMLIGVKNVSHKY